MKNEAYVINHDEYVDIGTQWIALYVNGNTKTYFDSFGVEHIINEIKKFIGDKNITTNVWRMQVYDSVMCGHFCIGFIDYMFTGKTLADFTNLFLPNTFNNNDKIILKYIKMSEASNIYSNLSDQTQFGLNKINEIKDYFIAEIHQREEMSKLLSNYIAAFDYFDKNLIFLSPASGGICIVTFATVIGAPVEIASANFSFTFSKSTGIVKKLLKMT